MSVDGLIEARIGEGAAPLMPLSALDICELLEKLTELYRHRDVCRKIESALGPLEKGDTTYVDLKQPLVPKTFEKRYTEGEFAGRAFKIMAVAEGVIYARRTE